MVTHVYIKWVPLLVISGGIGVFFHLRQGWSLPLLLLILLSNKHVKIQVLWRQLGQGSAKATF